MSVAAETDGYERSALGDLVVVEALDFVDAVDGGDAADDGLEFGGGVDAELDLADNDATVGLRVERLHREVKLVGDAVCKVYQQMMTVYGPYV